MQGHLKGFVLTPVLFYLQPSGKIASLSGKRIIYFHELKKWDIESVRSRTLYLKAWKSSDVYYNPIRVYVRHFNPESERDRPPSNHDKTLQELHLVDRVQLMAGFTKSLNWHFTLDSGWQQFSLNHNKGVVFTILFLSSPAGIFIFKNNPSYWNAQDSDYFYSSFYINYFLFFHVTILFQ